MSIVKETELISIRYTPNGVITLEEVWTYTEANTDEKQSHHVKKIPPGSLNGSTYQVTDVSGESAEVQHISQLWTNDIHEDYEDYLNSLA